MAVGRPKNRKGRSLFGHPHIEIPHYVLDSEIFRTLPSSWVKVLLYVIKRYNGSNNGKIAFGARSGCFVRHRGIVIDVDIGMSKSSVASALRGLEKCGFLVCTQEASFDQKRLVKEWRITWLRDNFTGEIPTKDFYKKQPVKRRARKPRAASQNGNQST